MGRRGSCFVSVSLAATALLLQGCEIPRHSIGNWRAKPSYLVTHEVVPPGLDDTDAVLNSCMSKDIPASMKCSGHGRCKEWVKSVVDPASGVAPSAGLSFCKCDGGWADPECQTQRKSQLTAFALSIFFGMFGADLFYLGYVWSGVFKLLTFGGGGVWYVFDIVRIGSAPALTLDRFKTTNDLHHTAFVLIVVCLMVVLGFVSSIMSISRQRQQKAKEVLVLMTEGHRSPLLADLDNGLGLDDFAVEQPLMRTVGGYGPSADDSVGQGTGPCFSGVSGVASALSFRAGGAGINASSLAAAPLPNNVQSGTMVYGSA